MDGSEQIPWRIVEKQENKLLLVSEYVINRIPFSDYEFSGESYNESFVKNWLNDSFYNLSFTDEEKALISSAYCDESGEITLGEGDLAKDHIFILSAEEVKRYLFGHLADGYPTVALKLTYEDLTIDGLVRYWTRTVEETGIVTVNDSQRGMFIESGETIQGIRPAHYGLNFLISIDRYFRDNFL